MRKSRFTEEQIAMALRQGEAGTPVEEICRKLGISEATYFRWKKQFGGLGVPELRELRQLREENRRLKGLVGDLTLDKTMQPERLRLGEVAEFQWSGRGNGSSLDGWHCRRARSRREREGAVVGSVDRNAAASVAW